MGDRPRDRLGRPVPRGSADGVEGVPDRTAVDARTAVAEAVDYLERGLPFHAHEVLEQRWRCAPAEERGLWRALAQAGAAVTHQLRGNEIGARRLVDRANAGLVQGGLRPLTDSEPVTLIAVLQALHVD